MTHLCVVFFPCIENPPYPVICLSFHFEVIGGDIGVNLVVYFLFGIKIVLFLISSSSLVDCWWLYSQVDCLLFQLFFYCLGSRSSSFRNSSTAEVFYAVSPTISSTSVSDSATTTAISSSTTELDISFSRRY